MKKEIDRNINEEETKDKQRDQHKKIFKDDKRKRQK
jgi:hypothetical protein